jgi:nickel/cobalt transporter (NicO) family protein
LTPGHSKTVLALFVAGSGAGCASGLRTAGILASTHILMSVLIILLGLPLVSMTFGEVGRAVALENLSHGLLGLVGL